MDRLVGFLLILVVFGIAAGLLYWLVVRILRQTVRVGDALMSALATGGVSLLSANPKADLAQDYRLPAHRRTRLAAIFDAFATGGVSLLSPLPNAAERDARRSSPDQAL
jgi:hypothetical protein